MDRDEVRQLLIATGEEITNTQGQVIGYASQPARFRLNRPYLARGGFLVVTRDEESGHYVGTEFDALPHPKTGAPYPAGHSERAFEVATIEEALEKVMATLGQSQPPGDRLLDLRGDVCPITFAKTKIALEDMAIGQVLRIVLDYEPATRNVPRSAEMYGDKVLAVTALGEREWEVLILKQVD